MTSNPDFTVIELLYTQLTRSLFAIAKFLVGDLVNFDLLTATRHRQLFARSELPMRFYSAVVFGDGQI